MDCLSQIMDIGNRLWDCSSEHMDYIQNLEENLEKLRTEKVTLISRRIDVQDRVEVAEQQPRMRRTKEVEVWLDSTMENEMNVIIQEGDQERQNKCVGGYCPKNLKSTYKIGKRISKMRDSLTDLLHKGESFNSESAVVLRQPRLRLLTNEWRLKNIVGVDSAVERVWSCIVDEKIRIIRLCGRGGVGKTTLFKKVSNEFHRQIHDFDAVLWAEVPRQEDYIEKVQQVVRRKLNIPDDVWNQCSSEDEKGAQIFSVLNGKKFVLLLDNVWEQFDLLRLGIDLLNDQNMSKVIFTAHSLGLYFDIEAQVTIEVECLPPEQALSLFRMTVGESILSSGLFNCSSIKEFKVSERCKLGNLSKVSIGDCPVLLNLNFLSYARNLEILIIFCCESLKEVTSEKMAFPQLKTISLIHLQNLKSICPPPRCFPSLLEIEVSKCPRLRQLPFDLESANFLLKIRGETEWWDGLIWDDEAVKDACHEKFVSTPFKGLVKKDHASLIQTESGTFKYGDLPNVVAEAALDLPPPLAPAPKPKPPLAPPPAPKPPLAPPPAPLPAPLPAPKPPLPLPPALAVAPAPAPKPKKPPPAQPQPPTKQPPTKQPPTKSDPKPKKKPKKSPPKPEPPPKTESASKPPPKPARLRPCPAEPPLVTSHIQTESGTFKNGDLPNVVAKAALDLPPHPASASKPKPPPAPKPPLAPPPAPKLKPPLPSDPKPPPPPAPKPPPPPAPKPKPPLPSDPKPPLPPAPKPKPPLPPAPKPLLPPPLVVAPSPAPPRKPKQPSLAPPQKLTKQLPTKPDPKPKKKPPPKLELKPKKSPPKPARLRPCPAEPPLVMTSESHNDNELNLEDIDAIKVIGKGNGGVVQLVKHKWTGQFFALKSFCTNGAISIILEYMDGGSLADFLKKVESISEPYLAAICKQVLKGLIYLYHGRHIIHRDLKPSNLLINHRGEVKINDFGVSAILTSSSGRTNTFVGTYDYMSPERIIGGSYDITADIWSLGLVLLECATGKFPYPPPEQAEGWTNIFELMEEIVEQPPPCAPSDQFSPEFCSFISACLQKDPKERKSSHELLALPFLNMYDDMDVDLSSYFTYAGSLIAIDRTQNVIMLGKKSKKERTDKTEQKRAKIN